MTTEIGECFENGNDFINAIKDVGYEKLNKFYVVNQGKLFADNQLCPDDKDHWLVSATYFNDDECIGSIDLYTTDMEAALNAHREISDLYYEHQRSVSNKPQIDAIVNDVVNTAKALFE